MEKDIKKCINLRWILLLAKYSLSFVFAVLFIMKTGYYKYFLLFLCEITILIVISNIIGETRTGKLIHYILFLLINVQMILLYFANSYLSMIMLSNLFLLEDLSGKKNVYICATIFVIALTIIPLRTVNIKKTINITTLSILFICEIALLFSCGSSYSPFVSYYQLICDKIGKEEWKIESDGTQKSVQFYNNESYDYIRRVGLDNQEPNIVLIFAEGLSMNIIEDERNIMPNIKEYNDLSIHFSNYYNHTAATLRGLIGQLYSGYQNENLDTNNLVSLENIFSDNGYETVCINTEPANKPFTNYLQSLGFDKVLGNKSMQLSGTDNTMTDEEAYDLLYDTIKDNKDVKTFTMIYTFGTHASLDSQNKYKDGSSPLLNKFYNLDCCFGNFMEKIKTDGIDDNTIVIFTTDHATYNDSDFRHSFTNYTRENVFVDRIPLFIYYKGVESTLIDANGRNSLDLAPTILDLLDISHDNYFLGESLFSLKGTDFSYISCFETDILTTKDCKIRRIDKDKKQSVKSSLAEYFTAVKEDIDN